MGSISIHPTSHSNIDRWPLTTSSMSWEDFPFFTTPPAPITSVPVLLVSGDHHMFRRRKTIPELNYTNIVWLAFTHPDNGNKSIRAIARQLGMYPGTVHRILIRLGYVKTEKPECHPETPETPSEHTHRADRVCLRDTVKSRKKRGDTDTPDTGKNKKKYKFDLLNYIAETNFSDMLDFDFDRED